MMGAMLSLRVVFSTLSYVAPVLALSFNVGGVAVGIGSGRTILIG